MLTLLFVPALLAEDLSLTATDDIDLSDAGAALSYEGGLSGNAPNYVIGKPLTITHSSGNVAVRCIEADRLTARVQYTVHGSAEGPMEAFGRGIGLAVWGDSKAGGVKTKIPGKSSNVAGAKVELTVNVPKGITALTVAHTGSGWVQILDCSGAVKVSAGGGGAFVSGALTSVVANATGGDVKVVLEPGAVLKGASAVTAPGGNATVVLASAQGGKMTAKGAEVSVQQTVMGTNEATLVSGDMGVAGPNIAISAKNRVEVTQQ